MGLECRFRVCSWGVVDFSRFLPLFFVLVSVSWQQPSLDTTRHIYNSVFRTKRGVLHDMVTRKGVFYVWFCTCSFLRLERLYGNGKGHLAFRREGRSCCLVVVVLCVLGYPEWSRAFTCPTLAERGVLVIALASSCICVLAPLQDGGRLLRR